jgi:uncharacterized membrane protein
MSEPSRPSGPSHLTLIISLCLNFLLAGVIVMAVVRFTFFRPEPFLPGAPPAPLAGSLERGQMHAMLSPRTLMYVAPEQRERIFALIQAHHPKIAALRSESMAARQEVMRLFSAPAFDQAAFDQALARTQHADAALETEILAIVSQTAGTLTPEERAAAAKAAGRGHGFGHGMRWRHGQGGDGPPRCLRPACW